MYEKREMAFNELPEALRQKVMAKLKKESKTEEQIYGLRFVERKIPENPRGLDEIIFQAEGLVVDTDDWDKQIPWHQEMGKLRDENVKGRMEELRGKQFEKYAFLYLRKWLRGYGWRLKRGKVIGGIEYDCLGWKGKKADDQHPNLAIEMYYPFPRKEQDYEFPHIDEKIKRMNAKLRKLKAKYTFILIFVSPKMKVTTYELAVVAPFSGTVVYQRHKFRTIKLLKNRNLNEWIKN